MQAASERPRRNDRIITTHYRYRRPRRKRQATPIEGSAVVKATTSQPVEGAASDDRKPAIVTARRPGAKDAPELSPEEHCRWGDAAQALFRIITKAAAVPGR